MMRNIILIALEQEAPNMAEWKMYFYRCWKVNAGITAARLIERHQPETVFNFVQLVVLTVASGIHEIKNFCST